MLNMEIYELLEGLFCLFFLFLFCMKRKGCGGCSSILVVWWLSNFLKEKWNGLMRCNLGEYGWSWN